MKLLISAGTKFKDLKKKFSQAYPYLKVEFYDRSYSKGKVSPIKDRISPEKLISDEATKSFESEMIDINRHRTVAELEKEFFEKFGISMQVSRKSGKIWIETSKTDDRTLKAQNLLGKMSSMPVGAERERMDVD